MAKRKRKLKVVAFVMLGIFALIAIGAIWVMQPVKPMLKKGDSVPVEQVTDINGQPLAIDKHENEKKTLLAFFRFAGCPVCNVRVHELSNAYQSLLEEGVEVVAVFESSPQTLRTYQTDFTFPFRIISDEEGTLYQAFGVKKKLGNLIRTIGDPNAKSRMKQGESLYGDKSYEPDGSMTRMTAEFLIQDGRIEKAHYGRHLADHLDLSSL